MSVKDTTGRGDLTEIHVAAALMRAGRRVLRPVSGGLRYDLLVDNVDGTYWRVQCKTGLLKDGYIVFRLRNSDARRPNGVSYRGQIECFGVFCPENGRTYLVPMTALTTSDSTARLRLRPARNGQQLGVRLASEFEI
jgi:PD-(D/E)XK endonuclease